MSALRHGSQWRYLLLAGWLVWPGTWLNSAKAATVVYSTQFEAGEGYSTNLDLIGQNGWQGEGSGGNGIITSYFSGQGQQAYLGYSPPNAGDDFLVVWHPLDLSPFPTNTPIVRFSTLMAIGDSSNTNYDYFQWTVYNSLVQSLFTIEFDNFYTNVWYALGTNFIPTGLQYSPDTPYTLQVMMDFSQNRWSATLSGVTLATNQPIAAPGVTLDLGDIDAAWLVYDTNAPGNNYMVFDNYLVTVESLPPPPATLQTLGRTSDGWLLLRLFGPSGAAYAIDATSDLRLWTPLKTNVVTGGYFDLIDTTAPLYRNRFYRGRLVQ